MRDLPVGNGSLLVNFDDKYQIRDIYFPHVGQENHTEGFPCRFGVWADGEFSWVASDDWTRELRYLKETLVTDVRLSNEAMGIVVRCNDTVASHENIFLRRIRITNLRENRRNFRVFLHHDFRIYESAVGDTAFFDPETRSLIHYKKHRYFLIDTVPDFDSFATGRKAFRGNEGTWRDAEDGELQQGTITEGSVDSTIGVHFELESGSTFEFFCWIAAGTTYEEVAQLDRLLHERGQERYLEYTENYWRAWVNKNDDDLDGIPDRIVDLYKRSLLIIHSQIDHGGAILAANDYDVTERATDHYSYLWTRDGAFVAHALDQAGYSHLTRKFFDFCGRIFHKDGYFLQKYNADGTVASGWHSPWDVIRGEKLVPIQEDETALVLWALWQHYERYRDIEFAHRLYRRMTIPAAEFMCSFRDETTGLPKPSWNLWENSRGVHTFTCSTVVAGLRAAEAFALLFAESDRAKKYEAAANGIVAAMRKHLYSSQHGRFLRSLYVNNDQLVPDPSIDASLFGVFYFGCFDPNDPAVSSTMQAVSSELLADGGIARFKNDDYMRASNEVTGNAWFICTLWLAEYFISRAAAIEELAPAMELIEWCTRRSLPSGVLSEQYDTFGSKQVSVSPLTWSHSTFVSTVLSYRAKLKELS